MSVDKLYWNALYCLHVTLLCITQEVCGIMIVSVKATLTNLSPVCIQDEPTLFPVLNDLSSLVEKPFACLGLVRGLASVKCGGPYRSHCLEILVYLYIVLGVQHVGTGGINWNTYVQFSWFKSFLVGVVRRCYWQLNAPRKYPIFCMTTWKHLCMDHNADSIIALLLK